MTARWSATPLTPTEAQLLLALAAAKGLTPEQAMTAHLGQIHPWPAEVAA